MTEPIKLPPLPQGYCANEIRPNYARQIFLENQVKAYARAAIEAVLESEEVKAWKKDAERYRAWRKAIVEDDFEFLKAYTEYEGISGELTEESMDEAIDHARRIEDKT